MSDVVFILGAGASIDAGMPSTPTLTEELRNRLDQYQDGIGNPLALGRLFHALAEHDPEVPVNYERFFEWLVFLHKCQSAPFHALVSLNLDPSISAAFEQLWLPKRLIVEILRDKILSDAYEPNYLAGLGKFINLNRNTRRLKVFSTNYDVCVEEACRKANLSVTTGFNSSGRWQPSIFHNDGGPGINLYKLHGSMNWGAESGLTTERRERLREWNVRDFDRAPELILGPPPKLLYDEPYVTLYAEFHKAIREAEILIAIGFSFRDEHIKNPVLVAKRERQLKLIDLNPHPAYFGNFLPNYENLCSGTMGAKKALDDGVLFGRVTKALSLRTRS